MWLLAQLYVNSVELLLESSHTTIQIWVDLLFLRDHGAFSALTTYRSLGGTAYTDSHDLVLVKVRHHLSVVL